MPDIRTGIVTSVGKMAKTITVTTRTMNAVPKLLVVSVFDY
jgi:ribosomal protein S17